MHGFFDGIYKKLTTPAGKYQHVMTNEGPSALESRCKRAFRMNWNVNIKHSRHFSKQLGASFLRSPISITNKENSCGLYCCTGQRRY